MLKCMIILACLVHKAPFNVLPRCPKVASLYMHSRVRKCPEQCQTCSNAWKISTYSWYIYIYYSGGFETINIFWTKRNNLSTTCKKKKKQKMNMIKNNSNIFKCHSFMHLYFHHHHLFQEADIHRQSHNTNFRFLFFLIQIHYGLSKRLFSFIYRIFSLLLHFDSPWMFWAFKTFFFCEYICSHVHFRFSSLFFRLLHQNRTTNTPEHENTSI